MSKNPQSIDELWPSPWLKAEHLSDKGAVVTIKETKLEQLRPNGHPETKLVITFERASRKLVCNKTQAYKLAEITGTREFAKWVGTSVKLIPGQAHNGKPTVIVLPAPATEVN